MIMNQALLLMATALASALFYMTLPGQRLLAAPLALVWRWGALFVLMLLLAIWCWSIEALAAVLSWLVVVMLTLGLLPTFTLLRKPASSPSDRSQS